MFKWQKWDLLGPVIHVAPSLHGLLSQVMRIGASHCLPAKPSGHSHLNVPIASLQVPPCLQGLLAHSSMSFSQLELENY